jgi:AI-2E family transporter
VDFALLWGLLSFLLSFVPNIGFIVSMIPPALLALLEFGPESAALVILAYCVINLLVDYALRPRIIGRDVDISQSVTFLGVIVWGLILGPVGALLSVPLTLIVRLLLEMASGTTRYSALIVEELPVEVDGEAPAVAADPPAPVEPLEGTSLTAAVQNGQKHRAIVELATPEPGDNLGRVPVDSSGGSRVRQSSPAAAAEPRRLSADELEARPDERREA